jgi:hypothetical protein
MNNIDFFREITGADEHTARVYLSRYTDLDTAVDKFCSHQINKTASWKAMNIEQNSP